MKLLMTPYIIPSWQPSKEVCALMTTRQAGVSLAPYDSMNVGSSTEDNVENVKRNKEILRTWLSQECSNEIESGKMVFLRQVHGCEAVCLDDPDIMSLVARGIEPVADACYTTMPGRVCIARAADCMPVLLAVPGGVAAIHAGWRGLAKGVVVKTLHKLLQATGKTEKDVVAWLGPCIGPKQFEVGDDVRIAFESRYQENTRAFIAGDYAGKWWANLPQLAQMELARCGVVQIYVDGRCTVTEKALFYSYRRDQKSLGDTGRMAACIWIKP